MSYNLKFQNLKNDAKYNQLLDDLKAKTFKISKSGKSFLPQTSAKTNFSWPDQWTLKLQSLKQYKSNNTDIIKAFNNEPLYEAVSEFSLDPITHATSSGPLHYWRSHNATDNLDHNYFNDRKTAKLL